MKVKNGKVKLGRSDVRVGNFVLREEVGHMKIYDISETYTHRASKRTGMGIYLLAAFRALRSGTDEEKERVMKAMQNYFAVAFTFFSTVPDIDFLETVYEASKGCIERHPEAYGIRPGEQTEKSDEEALEEVKAMKEFEEEVRKDLGGEPSEK